ncbi:MULTISPECIES: AI-2E family transporter [Mycobacterium]|uniref:AI-2E family transporter n=1 Tax=Mycobacterium syngnathidarum TaxID=1908205 RepID=A0A1S1K7F6_9MYCO|nr:MULTISPECIES: AI-2E family transporter [Mycobacterium]MCG7609839.1 AI-2E family transporter [Mycobacterium sp. CnD-18-1]OHU01401.1 AI-2E family transporter [Mycobacterium syngnathidarum]OLT95245.1 AI-2E family transporter [Mycobacterium syngnathidarum]TMS54135.1 AI-2E family transporter [Mycobacterium sp. DBP42]
MKDQFTLTQKRALAIFTVLALLLGAYFLRGFFVLIVMAAVGAYLFTPLYQRFQRRLGTGLSATLTVLVAILMVIIPVALVVFMAIVQVTQLVNMVSTWIAETDVSTLGDRALQLLNSLLERVPFLDIHLTADSLRDTVVKLSQHLGEWLLGILQGAVGGMVGAITASIIFLYVFISMLVNNAEMATLIRRLNPLGEEITDLYLAKTGAMVKGTVKGQFVIALCQGVAGAISIYIAGFHDGFFVFAILLTALSVIPLGGGIVTIPFGIGMMFFGNIIGGIFVVAFHLLVVTNIDNVLRPWLVPKAARLDPALMLLAVFAGISMFGFFGLVIGPVLMIIIVTTVSVYLAVFKGVELETTEPDEPGQRPWRRVWEWFQKRLGGKPDVPPAESEPKAEAESDGRAPA